MNLKEWLMCWLRGTVVPDPALMTPPEKRQREAELRFWQNRSDTVERMAELRVREKG